MEHSAQDDQRVMDLASMAMRHAPAKRESYLRDACNDDHTLLRDIAEVIELKERIGSFLQHSPIAENHALQLPHAGQLLSERFEIIEKIGEGGMGVVFVAFDRKRNQRIAIKCSKSGFHRLLSPELEGALKVRHPNVCLVNEIHTTETRHGALDFLTMELLEGETLAAHLQQHGKLPHSQAFEIACQLCSGLAEAHRSDVLHRDLKPANIILCTDARGTRAVITDFGLACDLEQPGELGGTPRYMAPELWKGRPASKASDIYSLGVVLYEMVTGQAPFLSRSASLEDQKPVRKPRSPSTLTPGLPACWDRVICHCLELAPEDRPADASLVLGMLQREPIPKAALLVLALVLLAPFSVPQLRTRLHDRIWPAPSIRLAILPIVGVNVDTGVAGGVLQDVADRVKRFGTGKSAIVVIPPAAVASNQVQTPEQAKAVLHATHALQTTVHREGEDTVFEASILDLNTRLAVRSFRGRYPQTMLGTAPGAIAGAITLALHLHGPSSPEVLSPSATMRYDQGLALLHGDGGDVDQAIASFEAAAQLDPRSPLPLSALAEGAIKKFKATNNRAFLTSAQHSLQAAENLSPDSVAVRLVAGLEQQTAGHYEQALAEYRRAQELDPTRIDTLLRIASAYNALDFNNEAVATYQKAIALQPDYYEPYRKLGEYFYFRSKYPEAAEQLGKAIERAPGLSDLYSELGGVLVDLGRDEDAEHALLTSIQLHETADARNSLGAIRAYQNREKEAVELYRRALVLDPQQYVFWLNLGDSSRRLAHPGEAVAAYRRGINLALAVLKEDPRDGYARAQVAYLSARLGDLGRAEQEISQALELSPGDTQVMRRAVLTYEALGQREKAIEALGHAPLTLLHELDRQPDLAAFRRDPRFKQLLAKT